MRQVYCAGPFGNEDLDGLTEQFIALIAEQPLDLGVGERDGAVGDDADDGIGGGLEQAAKLCLGADAVTGISHCGDHQRPVGSVNR